MRQALQFPELTARRQFPTHSTEKGELRAQQSHRVEEVEISIEGGQDS